MHFYKSDQEKFKKVRTIREVVFIEEQEVEERDEFDEYEDSSQHYLMCLDEKPIGTARWRHVGDKVKLERFAILKDYRGAKNGDALLQKVIEDAAESKKPMYLHAQLKAIPFYERRGFKKVGNLFLECDIKHYKMELNLT